LWIIFFLALSLRALYIFTCDNSSMGTWADQGGDIALNMLRGRGYVTSWDIFVDRRSFRMPVMPLTLYAIWSVVGYNLLIAKLVMAVLSAVTCVLVALLTQRLFNRAAIFVGIAAAVFPNSIYWTGTVGTETLTSFALCLGILLLASPKLRFRHAWAGLAIGLLASTRPIYLPYAALLSIFLMTENWTEGELWRAALFPVIVALVLLPWVIRNWQVHHAFLITSTEGGMTFLESNNPIAFREGGDWIPRYAASLPEIKKLAAVLPEVAMDREMYRRGLDFVRDDPGEFAKAFVLRLIKLWRPLPRLGAKSELNWKHALVLALTWLPAFAVGLATILRERLWKRKSHVPIFIAFFCVTMFSCAFSTHVRYRAPLEPYFLIYGAVGVASAIRHIKSSGARYVGVIEAA
jgi:hypothetical protein